MFCVRCGVALQPGQGFCPACGKPTVNLPLMPAQSRLAGHMRLLAILWFAISAFRLLPGIFLSAMFGLSVEFLPADVPLFVPVLLKTIGYLFIGTGAVGLIAGWGLLDRQPWARTLTIVLGALSLVDLPFGTALGIYTLWVLLPAQSEEEFRQISNAV